jgi:hypothetical protein
MAYLYLEKHPMIRDHFIPFPPLSEIEAYCGLNIIIRNYPNHIDGEGPDNPSKSFYADHYFNPTIPPYGAGNAPDRINELYTALCNDLTSGLTDPNTAKNAAYLAHYIQDMTCPFHVIGAPDNDLQFTASAAGPYIEKFGERTCILKDGVDSLKACTNPVTNLIEGNLRFFEQDETGFWDMMAERYIKDPAQGKNWFEPNYYNGHICPKLYTYLSTHFLYEAMVAHYHNNPEMVNRFSHLSNINFLTNNWNSLALSPGRSGEFAKKLARFTKDDLDNYKPEFMFDPKELVSYTFVAYKALGYVGMLTEEGQKDVTAMKSTVPMPENAWTTAIQATYTIWRASFSALFVDCETDVMLFQAGSNPDTYTARVKLTNYEPGETVKNITANLKLVSNGVTSDIGTATVAKLPDNQNSNSTWLVFKEPFALPVSAQLKVEITGTYEKVPDAGRATYTSKNPAMDPLGGSWYMQETKASVAILYDSKTQQYEGKVTSPGDLAFHSKGVLMLTGVKPVETQVKVTQPGEKYYAGTECSWEALTNPDGTLSKGPQTRLPVSITVNGNTMVYCTKDETLHFTRK